MNKPKYLWAFIGYCFLSGLVTSVVISPACAYLSKCAGAISDRTMDWIYWVINTIVGFVVFRFFVWYFVARPNMKVYSESKTALTEQAESGDGNTRT